MKGGDKFLVFGIAILVLFVAGVMIYMSMDNDTERQVDNSGTNKQGSNLNSKVNDRGSDVDNGNDYDNNFNEANETGDVFLNLSDNVTNIYENLTNLTIDNGTIYDNVTYNKTNYTESNYTEEEDELLLTGSGDIIKFNGDLVLDLDGDIVDWRIDDQSYAVLNMPMEGDVSDYSTYSNDGILPGGSSSPSLISDGQIGSAYSFDGNDYINLGQSASLNFHPEDAFTIEVWFRDITEGSIVCKGDSVWDERQYCISIEEGRLWAYIGAGRSRTDVIPNLNDGEWHYMVTSFGDGGHGAFYYDGEVVHSGIGRGDALNNYDIIVGGRRVSGNSGVEFMIDGDLDELKMYNRELSKEQVAINYEEGKKKRSPRRISRKEFGADETWGVVVDGSKLTKEVVVNGGILQCSEDSNCPDGNSCQKAACVFGVCGYDTVSICSNNDGCCLASCSYLNDNDCMKPVDFGSNAVLKAFPGAIGFGAKTRGAYSGSSTPKILIVDNLDWNENLGSSSTGRGSLAWALAQDYPRVVLFEVSGTIDAGRITSSPKPYLTLAGQSAPSPGVLLKDHTMAIAETNDIIMQHMRFRGSAENRDAMTLYKSSNIMIDHCSLSWSEDEVIGITTGFEGVVHEELRDLTFSNNIISEGLNDETDGPGEYDSKAMLIMGGQKIAIVRNLFASHFARIPYVRNGASELYIANNWIHNTMAHNINIRDSFRPVYATVVGNILTRGPNTRLEKVMVSDYSLDLDSEVYVDNNKDLVSSNWRTDPVGIINFKKIPVPLVNHVFVNWMKRIDFPDYDLLDAEEVPDALYSRVGARPKDRDSVDTRVVQEARSGAGYIPFRSDLAWPNLAENRRSVSSIAGYPSDPHGDSDNDGYTNMEEWLHIESEKLIP